MPAATSDDPAGGDDLDNLLDYDGAVEDFWKDLPETNGGNANDTNNAQPEMDMDEEVKVTKKRKPNPKLDQERLLSNAGIPKLRRIAKDKLKFKGKGHEFSDISRMLTLYQLWLDDLYPKAKFRDGLAMVEKLGHSKRLQVSRRAWIEESKTHRRREDDEANTRMEDIAQAEDDPIFPVPSATTQQNLPQQQTGGGDAPDEDDLDALLREQDGAPAATNPDSNAPARAKGPFEDDDEPDEDELDALLNEDLRQTNIAPQPQPNKQKGPFEEDDQDELDMLLAEEPQQSLPAEGGNNNDSAKSNPTQGGEAADFADDEEAMAEMGW